MALGPNEVEKVEAALKHLAYLLDLHAVDDKDVWAFETLVRLVPKLIGGKKK